MTAFAGIIHLTIINGCLIMQIQKSDIKNRIIQSAVSQFIKFGYKGSSMRTIAKIAGITPGNIYAYFENKNELLCYILDESVTKLNDFIIHIYENETYTSQLLKCISNEITDLFLKNKDELLILFGDMQGSKYENIKTEIISAVAKRIHDGMTMHSPYVHDILLSEAIATAYIEGIIRIMLTSGDDDCRLIAMVNDFTQIIFTVNLENDRMKEIEN